MAATVSMDTYNRMETELTDEVEYLRAKNKHLKRRHQRDLRRVSHYLHWLRDGAVDVEKFDRLVRDLAEELYGDLDYQPPKPPLSTDDAIAALRAQLTAPIDPATVDFDADAEAEICPECGVDFRDVSNLHGHFSEGCPPDEGK